MNSTVIATISICSVLILAALIFSWASIRAISNQNLQTLANLAQRSEQERKELLNQWSKERQDFLNRLMAKTWQSYIQVSNGRVSTSDETLTPEEIDRGTGEVLIDLD